MQVIREASQQNVETKKKIANDYGIVLRTVNRYLKNGTTHYKKQKTPKKRLNPS